MRELTMRLELSTAPCSAVNATVDTLCWLMCPEFTSSGTPVPALPSIVKRVSATR